MTKIRTFRKYGSAKKAANGNPVLVIRGGGTELYVVIPGDRMDVKLTEIGLISGNGNYAGTVTVNHLNRLGNANYAVPSPGRSYSEDAFAEAAP